DHGGLGLDSRNPFPVLASLGDKSLAPQVGLEPTTLRLTAECSTIELLRSNDTPLRRGPEPFHSPRERRACQLQREEAAPAALRSPVRVCSAARLQEKPAAFSRPTSTSRPRRSASLRSLRTAAAIDSAECGSKNRAALPAASRSGGMSEQATGRPAAIASRTG